MENDTASAALSTTTATSKAKLSRTAGIEKLLEMHAAEQQLRDAQMKALEGRLSNIEAMLEKVLKAQRPAKEDGADDDSVEWHKQQLTPQQPAMPGGGDSGNSPHHPMLAASIRPRAGVPARRKVYSSSIGLGPSASAANFESSEKAEPSRQRFSLAAGKLRNAVQQALALRKSAAPSAEDSAVNTVGASEHAPVAAPVQQKQKVVGFGEADAMSEDGALSIKSDAEPSGTESTAAIRDVGSTSSPSLNANDDGGFPTGGVGKASRRAGATGAFTEQLRAFQGATTLDPEGVLVTTMEFAYIPTTAITFIMLVSLIHPLTSNDLDELPPTYYIVWLCVLSVFSALFTIQRARIRRRTRSDSWLLVDSVDEAWALYKRGWFAFDLLMTIPLEFAFIGWLNRAFVYASCVRNFPRVARMVSLRTQENPLSGTKGWFQFAAFCGALAMIIHVMACGFWSIMEGTVSYIDALYFSCATASSIGYGDVVPTTSDQRIFTIVCMLSSVLMLSSFTAQATKYLTSRDVISQQKDDAKSMMSALLTYYRVPWRLSKEVVAVFPSVLDANIQAHFRSSIDNLPPFLRDELTKYVNASHLRSLALFEGLNEATILKLAAAMHMQFVQPFEYVVAEGEEATAMYIILHGIVEVTVVDGEREVVLATLRDGECFGEAAMVNETLRNANVLAVVSCQLLVLDKTLFKEVLAESTTLRARILTRTHSRTGKAMGQAVDATNQDRRESLDFGAANPLVAGARSEQ